MYVNFSLSNNANITFSRIPTLPTTSFRATLRTRADQTRPRVGNGFDAVPHRAASSAAACLQYLAAI